MKYQVLFFYKTGSDSHSPEVFDDIDIAEQFAIERKSKSRMITDYQIITEQEAWRRKNARYYQ